MCFFTKRQLGGKHYCSNIATNNHCFSFEPCQGGWLSCAECVRPFPRNEPSRVRRGMSPASRLAAILDIAGTKLLCLLSSSELSLQPASSQAVFLISCRQVGGCTCPHVRAACPWFLLLGTHSWIRRHFTCFKQSQYFVGICFKKKTTTHTHKI